MATYACSDIHGRWDLFQRMLQDINFTDKDTLYILGDLIDRGPDNVNVLRYAMEHDNVHALLGNHELMMYVHYRCRGLDRDYWDMDCNGGASTAAEIRDLPDGELDKILNFIREMDLQKSITIGGMHIMLSHSCFLPQAGTCEWKDIGYERVRGVVWDSPWRFWEYVPACTYRVDDRWHVIGHVPVQHIPEWQKSAAYVDEENRIVNIDLGCARIGVTVTNDNGDVLPCGLCCMDLEKFAAGEDAFRYYFPNSGE